MDWRLRVEKGVIPPQKTQMNETEGRGVKEFVRVLRLHQEYAAPLIEQAVQLALSYGCVHFDGVSQCLHQLQQPPVPLPLLDLSDKPHLAAVGTQPVDLHRYEQLLERHQ